MTLSHHQSEGIENIVSGHAERFVPAMTDPKITYEHIHRYAYASLWAQGKQVLDIACGEGYGSWILAKAAEKVTGIDQDRKTIRHAQEKYNCDKIKFVQGNIESLPFESKQFDIIICFEAIEHVHGQKKCISEMRRVLRDDGIILISTPKKIVSAGGAVKNPFHVHELTLAELGDLLRAEFKQVKFVGQKVSLASEMWNVPLNSGGSHNVNFCFEKSGGYVNTFDAVQERDAAYHLAVASDRDVFPLPDSLLTHAVHDELEELIKKLQGVQERRQELEWALECCSRIMKKKKEVSTLDRKRLLELEAMTGRLKKSLSEKEKNLQKMMGLAYRIFPMHEGVKRPQTIDARVSVIIPVKNGGGQLQGLFDKIGRQKKVRDIEIIIVDSESTDDSVAIAEGCGARVVRIPQREFNHGKSRNIGAEAATGDYLVFTVQDAIPVSDYWLYNMVAPFIEHPRLSALSARQFIKPEADLFSLWKNELMIKLLGFDKDAFWSKTANVALESFDSLTKRRITFFDNVASCVRKSIFKEIQFAPLINAEDIDFGVKLFERGDAIGYVSSTGVYHWHNRGADDVMKRHYVGARAQVCTLKNELPYFFDRNTIMLDSILQNVAVLYNIINITIHSVGNKPQRPEDAVKQFVHTLKDILDLKPHSVEKNLKENDIHGDNGLDSLLLHFSGERVFIPEQAYDFKQNFLIPGFMSYLGQFAEYIYSAHQNLTERGNELVPCIYKIFAMVTGDALGAYYIESELRKSITPELQKLDRLLTKGVCYF